MENRVKRQKRLKKQLHVQYMRNGIHQLLGHQWFFITSEFEDLISKVNPLKAGRIDDVIIFGQSEMNLCHDVIFSPSSSKKNKVTVWYLAICLLYCIYTSIL